MKNYLTLELFWSWITIQWG